MQIQLPDDLMRFVDDQIRGGRFASEGEAVERLRQAFGTAPSPGEPDPVLGSMREDGAFVDEIVEEAMRAREARTWRPVSLD